MASPFLAVPEGLSEKGDENNNKGNTSKKPNDYGHSFSSVVAIIIAVMIATRRIAVKPILCISHIAFAEINLPRHSSPADDLELLHSGIDTVVAV